MHNIRTWQCSEDELAVLQRRFQCACNVLQVILIHYWTSTNEIGGRGQRVAVWCTNKNNPHKLNQALHTSVKMWSALGGMLMRSSFGPFASRCSSRFGMPRRGLDEWLEPFGKADKDGLSPRMPKIGMCLCSCNLIDAIKNGRSCVESRWAALEVRGRSAQTLVRDGEGEEPYQLTTCTDRGWTWSSRKEIVELLRHSFAKGVSLVNQNILPIGSWESTCTSTHMTNCIPPCVFFAFFLQELTTSAHHRPQLHRYTLEHTRATLTTTHTHHAHRLHKAWLACKPFWAKERDSNKQYHAHCIKTKCGWVTSDDKCLLNKATQRSTSRPPLHHRKPQIKSA